MTNYEKLCGIIEICIEPKLLEYPKHRNYILKHPNGECIPTFTTEKQIELIKLLAATESFTVDFSEIPPRNDNEQWACMCKFKSAFSADFAEALAGLTLQLIEAGELGKDEVRRILRW